MRDSVFSIFRGYRRETVVEELFRDSTKGEGLLPPCDPHEKPVESGACSVICMGGRPCSNGQSIRMVCKFHDDWRKQTTAQYHRIEENLLPLLGSRWETCDPPQRLAVLLKNDTLVKKLKERGGLTTMTQTEVGVPFDLANSSIKPHVKTTIVLTRQDWDECDIKRLGKHNVVRVGNAYYKPAQTLQTGALMMEVIRLRLSLLRYFRDLAKRKSLALDQALNSALEKLKSFREGRELFEKVKPCANSEKIKSLGRELRNLQGKPADAVLKAIYNHPRLKWFPLKKKDLQKVIMDVSNVEQSLIVGVKKMIKDNGGNDDISEEIKSLITNSDVQNEVKRIINVFFGEEETGETDLKSDFANLASHEAWVDNVVKAYWNVEKYGDEPSASQLELWATHWQPKVGETVLAKYLPTSKHWKRARVVAIHEQEYSLTFHGYNDVTKVNQKYVKEPFYTIPAKMTFTQLILLKPEQALIMLVQKAGELVEQKGWVEHGQDLTVFLYDGRNILFTNIVARKHVKVLSGEQSFVVPSAGAINTKHWSKHEKSLELNKWCDKDTFLASKEIGRAHV